MSRFQLVVLLVVLSYFFPSFASLHQMLKVYPRTPYMHYRFTNLLTRDGRQPSNAGVCMYMYIRTHVFVCASMRAFVPQVVYVHVCICVCVQFNHDTCPDFRRCIFFAYVKKKSVFTYLLRAMVHIRTDRDYSDGEYPNGFPGTWSELLFKNTRRYQCFWHHRPVWMPC